MNKIDITPSERELLAQLLQARGRDPASFQVAVQPDGWVRVSGRQGTACYSRDDWMARFSRHLEKSFFDPKLPTPVGLERRSAREVAQQA